MNIVFAGTPEFAVPALERLKNAGHDIRLVVSQPDRPSGRGLKVAHTPVKKKCLELGLKIFQPEDINSEKSLAEISACEPDLMVVVAFGQILKKKLLEIPKKGCFNIHASLLPLLRGAAPIQRSIMEGHTSTGITTIKMNRKMDAGDIMLSSTIPIEKNMTAGRLHDILSEKGAETILETLLGIENGTVTPLPQDNDSVTYAPKIETGERLIDWKRPAEEIDHKIRGLSPKPGAYTFFKGKRLTILESSIGNIEASNAPPGRLVEITSKYLEVQTGDGTVALLSVRPEGKREMRSGDWAFGARIDKNEYFGEK